MTNHPLVQEFMDMVKIGAVSGDERGVADALLLKLEAIGCTVTEDKVQEHWSGNCGNLFTAIEGGCEGSILFTAHTDRVTGGYNIKPSIKDGYVISDGTTILAADDLSGAMAIIEGVRRVLASGKKSPRVEILFCPCEEVGLLGSRYFDASVLQSKIAYAIDSPGNAGRVVRAAPSRACITLETFGRAAHAGTEPEKGVNALVAMAKILANIKDGRLDEETTANFALIEAGNSNVNSVQDYVKVEGEVRSHCSAKVDEYLRYLDAYCENTLADSKASVKVTSSIAFHAFDIAETGESISLAKEVFEQMGITMIVERSGGGMDANNLNSMGVECVGLASGYLDNHTFREKLDIAEFLKTAEVVERLIMTYAQKG